MWVNLSLGHPYAMWGVYKGLEVYDVSTLSNVPGGFPVGQDWDPQVSPGGDWYEHYCETIVNNGVTSGYSYFSGPLSTGWYVNILNAAGVPEPQNIVPEPATIVIWSLLGMCFAGAYRWRRRNG